MDEEDKLEKLFSHLINLTVESVYIDENDEFVIEFSDGTLIQLFSDEGDLGLYYELNEEKPKFH